MKPKRLKFNDGSIAEIQPDGRWDIALPNGRHVRGRAADVAAAESAVQETRKAFIISSWEQGEPANHRSLRPGRLCPLNVD